MFYGLFLSQYCVRVQIYSTESTVLTTHDNIGASKLHNNQIIIIQCIPCAYQQGK